MPGGHFLHEKWPHILVYSLFLATFEWQQWNDKENNINGTYCFDICASYNWIIFSSKWATGCDFSYIISDWFDLYVGMSGIFWSAPWRAFSLIRSIFATTHICRLLTKMQKKKWSFLVLWLKTSGFINRPNSCQIQTIWNAVGYLCSVVGHHFWVYSLFLE